MTLAEKLFTLNGSVWNLGQLDRESLAWLKRETKAGRLRKSRARWPGFTTGTCTKTVWLETLTTQ